MRVFFSVIFLSLISFSNQLMAGLPSHDSQGKPLPTLAPMLKQVNPAVVNIATYYTRVEVYQSYNPFLNDPFFRHFFNIPDRRKAIPKKRQNSAGSGVIVDANNGTVITNYHVIEGADEVQVSLTDGRTYLAEVKGTDPELDIAVLSIEADDLSEIPLANSDQLQVGDFVVAIGNPFGLGQTVTTGIVSALGRSGLGIEGYENFIQTDASINPGNSGGALVNLSGELVGINTAIIAPAGGNVGIGFAIPVNMANVSMEQILNGGEVKRGQLGVTIQEITQSLRQAFGLKNGQNGVAISEVVRDSTADKAGLKEGDVILSINNTVISSAAQFRGYVGTRRIGEKLKVKILRNKREKTLKVKVAEPQINTASLGELNRLLEGLTVSESRQGLMISAITNGSIAEQAGLQAGDIIQAVNRYKVDELGDFRRIISGNERQLMLHIQRQGRRFYLVLE